MPCRHPPPMKCWSVAASRTAFLLQLKDFYADGKSEVLKPAESEAEGTTTTLPSKLFD